MRIVSWNLNHWQTQNLSPNAWDYLDSDLSSDIAILQECVPRQKARGFIGETYPLSPNLSACRSYVWNEIDDKRKWGSGIFTKNHPLREIPFKTQYFGCLCVAEVKIADTVLTCVSIYGKIEYGYSIIGLHHMLSDLTLLLDGKMGRDRKIVLAGDFNASLQWDEQQPGESHRILFERIENFGLTDLVKAKYGKPIQTWRKANVTTEWQLDHMFVSKNLEPVIGDVFVRDLSAVNLSDHNPIILDLNL